MKKVSLDVKRLKSVSATTKDQVQRWNEKEELSVEDVETAFPVIPFNSAKAQRAKALVDKGPSKDKEAGVQEMWNGAMPYLVTTWRDCRSPNGIQFDGRRHDIDLTLLARDVPSIAYLDTSIELKDTIATDAKRREVVLQLLDRFGATFDGQSERKECWGLGMDSKSLLFVKCTNDNNMSYSVSPNFDLTGMGLGWDLLLRFLNAASGSRGYVPVTMPVLWGKSPLSLLSRNVYLLENGIVCKVGPEAEIRHERDLLLRVAAKASFLVPQLENAGIDTENADLPFGIQMVQYDVISVKNEAEVVEVASNIFWGLAVLHKLGIVHKDVKPSNFLSNPNITENCRYLLCDYGAAETWRTHGEMGAAATEAFASIPGMFQDTGTSMFLRDLEALFWSVFAIWLQVVKNRETPSAFRISRQVDFSVLRDQGGSFVGEEDTAPLCQPADPLLKRFLVGQARDKKLLCPSTEFQKYVAEGGITVEDFNAKAAEDHILPCPPEIFDWLLGKGQKLSTSASIETTTPKSS